MIQIVLDTNVVVSGVLWGGSPRLLLDAARHGRARLFTSTALLAELDETLRYPKFNKKIVASGLCVGQILDLYTSLATVVRPARIAPIIVADPDDDAVLACALAASAQVIVSGDRHLLGLRRWRDIEILSVSAALAWISDATEHDSEHQRISVHRRARFWELGVERLLPAESH